MFFSNRQTEKDVGRMNSTVLTPTGNSTALIPYEGGTVHEVVSQRSIN